MMVLLLLLFFWCQYPSHCKTDKQLVNTLQDNIIQRGAPLKLLSDRGQAIVSHKVADILRTF
jgi:hypothetical protein